MEALAVKPTAVRGAATRDALLDAAEALIADHGFRTPSHRMIAGEAGAHVALLNYHFGSKEMLFEAAVERRADRLAQAWRAALAEVRLDPDRTVEDVLRAWWYPFGDLHVQEDLQWRNYLCVVARLASAPDGNDWYQRYFGTVDRDFQRALAESLRSHDQCDLDAGFRYARACSVKCCSIAAGRWAANACPAAFAKPIPAA